MSRLNQGEQVNVAKDELIGVQYLQALRGPMEHIAQHAALSSAVLEGDRELQTQQLAARQTVANDLDRLATVDRQIGAKLATGSRVATKANSVTFTAIRATENQ